jgi:hypothetical protein
LRSVEADPFGTRDRHDPERAGVLRPAPARAPPPGEAGEGLARGGRLDAQRRAVLASRVQVLPNDLKANRLGNADKSAVADSGDDGGMGVYGDMVYPAGAGKRRQWPAGLAVP